jgi:hypothetical protein
MKDRKSYFLIIGLILAVHELVVNTAVASPSSDAHATGPRSVRSDVGLFRNSTAKKVIVESELLTGAMIVEVVPGDVGPLPIRNGGLITVSMAPYEGRSMVEMFKYVVHYRASRTAGNATVPIHDRAAWIRNEFAGDPDSFWTLGSSG